MQKISTLSRLNLLFPLALVLFEFSVYIANDMIQPGMLVVTREFGVGPHWAASAMSAFILGSALFQWLFGPLSDRIGRRPVMLWGVTFFIVSCLATLLSQSMESFLALRLIQGIGLCFISSVGYATVQEAFEEKAAIRLTALMANVALIAPLIGPVVGALLIQVLPWRMVFVVIAAISGFAWIGLYRHMPETVVPRAKADKLPLIHVWHDYRKMLTHRDFLRLALVIALLTLPLLGWIALSPVILMEEAKMDITTYGLWQMPVFGALIVGNIVLAVCTDRWRLGDSVRYARLPLIVGMVTMVLGEWLFPGSPYFLIAGMCFIGFGEGLATAVLYRFAFTVSTVSKGTVAASLGMITMMIYGLMIEVFKVVYAHTGMLGFATVLACLVMLALYLSGGVLQAQERRVQLRTGSTNAANDLAT